MIYIGIPDPLIIENTGIIPHLFQVSDGHAFTGSRTTSDFVGLRFVHGLLSYTRNNGVPPTVDQMLANVEGKKSKSTIHARLKNLVNAGLLVQKNVKGYYYPTSIDLDEISVPVKFPEKIQASLLNDGLHPELSGQLEEYIRKNSGIN